MSFFTIIDQEKIIKLLERIATALEHLARNEYLRKYDD